MDKAYLGLDIERLSKYKYRLKCIDIYSKEYSIIDLFIDMNNELSIKKLILEVVNINMSTTMSYSSNNMVDYYGNYYNFNNSEDLIQNFVFSDSTKQYVIILQKAYNKYLCLDIDKENKTQIIVLRTLEEIYDLRVEFLVLRTLEEMKDLRLEFLKFEEKFKENNSLTHHNLVKSFSNFPDRRKDYKVIHRENKKIILEFPEAMEYGVEKGRLWEGSLLGSYIGYFESNETTIDLYLQDYYYEILQTDYFEDELTFYVALCLRQYEYANRIEKMKFIDILIIADKLQKNITYNKEKECFYVETLCDKIIVSKELSEKYLGLYYEVINYDNISRLLNNKNDIMVLDGGVLKVTEDFKVKDNIHITLPSNTKQIYKNSFISINKRNYIDNIKIIFDFNYKDTIEFIEPNFFNFLSGVYKNSTIIEYIGLTEKTSRLISKSIHNSEFNNKVKNYISLSDDISNDTIIEVFTNSVKVIIEYGTIKLIRLFHINIKGDLLYNKPILDILVKVSMNILKNTNFDDRDLYLNFCADMFKNLFMEFFKNTSIDIEDIKVEYLNQMEDYFYKDRSMLK